MSKTNQPQPVRVKTFKMNVDSKYFGVLITIAFYEATEVEFPTFVCIDAKGDYSEEILTAIAGNLNKKDNLLQLIDSKPSDNEEAYDVYLNVEGLTETSIEEEINKILSGTSLKACFIETSEMYESDDLYDCLCMYEAYIEDENEVQVSETTGRYCDMSSVRDELIGFAEDYVNLAKQYIETKSAFCPHCLEDHTYDADSNECNGCGGQIPDGIIDLENSLAEMQPQVENMKKAFTALGYSENDIKNITEAQPVMCIQADHTKKPDNEPDSVRYFAAGQVKNGLFTGLIHGFEGGGQYSGHCMLDGKFMPHIADDVCIEDDVMEDMLNKHTDKTFLNRCYNMLSEYIEYSVDGYFYEIKDRSKFNKFEPVSFARPDYANTTFGNEAGYWSNEEYLLKKCNIKELAKETVAQHHIMNNDLQFATLVEETMRAFRDDEVYGPFFTEKIEKTLREYLDAILDHIEENSLTLDDLNLMDCDICVACDTVLLPEDELYESHKGESLCTSCSILCEGCDKYYVEDEMTLVDGTHVCEFCSKGVDHVN